MFSRGLREWPPSPPVLLWKLNEAARQNFVAETDEGAVSVRVQAFDMLRVVEKTANDDLMFAVLVTRVSQLRRLHERPAGVT